MPSYKLFYFNTRGAAELARLVFKQAGVEFEDFRFTREEWPKYKDDQPLKAVPVLEVDGKKVCQSHAIARYLARAFGLFGSSSIEAFLIDELLEVIMELFVKQVTPVFVEQDLEKKVEMMKELKETTSVPYFDLMEKRLKENSGGRGFYVGDKITLADLAIYNTMHALRNLFGKSGFDPTEGRALLDGLYQRVEALPNIAAWIKQRPESDM